jgi:hypothetical protein
MGCKSGRKAGSVWVAKVFLFTAKKELAVMQVQMGLIG